MVGAYILPICSVNVIFEVHFALQKNEVFHKAFFRKCDQILRKLRSAVLVPSNIPKGIEMELIWLGRGLDSYF